MLGVSSRDRAEQEEASSEVGPQNASKSDPARVSVSAREKTPLGTGCPPQTPGLSAPH